MPPMASDVEGGGKFVNRADDFFVVHRYSQHSTDWIYTDIHVRKIKELESGGRPTPSRWTDQDAVHKRVIVALA